MPIQVIPENPQDDWSDDDWYELMGQVKPGGAAVMSQARSENGYEILIPARKVRAATRRLLGYSVADTASPWRLRRPEVPYADPVFPWLWADGISWQFEGPKGDRSRPHPEYPTQLAYLPQMDAIDTGGPATTGRYQWARGTVRFAPVGGTLGDGDYPATLNEYDRFLWLDKLAPSSQIVTAEGGTGDGFKWAEGPGDLGAGPKSGADSPVLIAPSSYVYKTTAGYTLVWKCVEQTYCCTGTDTMPSPKRLLAALGKVNDAPFPDPSDANTNPAGTLLFDALEGYRYQLPLRTTGATGLWAWDWRLTLTWFDPVRGKTDPSGKRGHYLLPYRGDGRWYFATRGSGAGTAGGVKTVESTAFPDIFKHAQTL